MGKRLFLLIVIAALVIAALPVSVGAQDDGRAAKLALTERFEQELWGNRQYDIADEIIADDFVVHFWPSTDMDWETYLESTVKVTHAVFPDYNSSQAFFLVDGDYVVVGDNWGGTFEQEWFGLPPSGADTRVNGVDFFRIEDGKIAEVWILFDTLSFMEQMGAVPVEGAIIPDIPWEVTLGETSSTPVEHKALLAEMVQNTADHDMDAYFAHFAEDSVVHDQDGDMVRDEAKEMMIGIQSAWPDHHAADIMYFADGDLAVILFTLVLAEDEVMIGGVNVDRFEDGEVAEEWWIYDASTLNQLLAPPVEE